MNSFRDNQFIELEDAFEMLPPTTPSEFLHFLTSLGRTEWLVLIMCLCALRVFSQIAMWVARPVVTIGCGIFWSLYRTTDWVLRRTVQHIVVKPEPAPTKKKPAYLTLEGEVTTRTVEGQTAIFGYVTVAGVRIDVMVNPKWYSFLPEALLISRKEEAAVDYSIVSPVAQNSEPPSLVALQAEDGTHLGCGARVNYQSSTILLTCAHVLAAARKSRSGNLYICKQNKDGVLMRIAIPPQATAVFGDIHSTFDAVGLNLNVGGVETPIWSKLGVGAATVKTPPTARTTISVYGYDGGWHSSSGLAIASVEPGSFVHTATTQPGWSGSPLYSSQGGIIGLHKSAFIIGKSNLATILFPIFTRRESEQNFRGFSEIRDEEMDFREGVTELDISGLGRYRFTKTEFQRPSETNEQIEARLRISGRPLWSEMADEFLAASLDESYLESGDSLNCQRGSEIAPTPSTPVSEPAVLASSPILPPPRRTPILDMFASSPSTSSEPPACVVAHANPTGPSSTPLIPPACSELIPDLPPTQDQGLMPRLNEMQSLMGDVALAAEDAQSASQQTQNLLLDHQVQLQEELAQRFNEMAMRLEDTIMSKIGSQLACLSTKLDAQMSASGSVEPLASPPRSRRRRSPSQSLTITRGRRGGQQLSSPPSSSKQETTTQYRPLQGSSQRVTASSSSTRGRQ